jgi:hypothetical protein
MEARKHLLILLDTEDDIKIVPDFVALEEFAEEELAPDSATVGVADRRPGVVHSSIEPDSIYGNKPRQRAMQS